MRDQAAGLRRMVADPKPRMFTILSASSRDDKTVLLVNLAAAMQRGGSNVLLLDACGGPAGLSGKLGLPLGASLLDALHGRCSYESVAHRCAHGYDVALLAGASATAAGGTDGLAAAYQKLALQSDVLITDVELDSRGALPFEDMAGGEIIVQVNASGASMTAAYALIKGLNAHLGRRPFGIVVSGASGEDARKVFDNMAQTASRYLALELQLAGSIPADDSLRKATRLERPVVDAFPMAASSAAFRQLASQFSATSRPPNMPVDGNARVIHAGADMPDISDMMAEWPAQLVGAGA
ncbi:MAG: MinD/ParA family ATP-binding protein [Janthinobacterium lividum]